MAEQYLTDMNNFNLTKHIERNPLKKDIAEREKKN